MAYRQSNGLDDPLAACRQHSWHQSAPCKTNEEQASLYVACLLLQQFVPDGIAVVTTGSAAPDAKLYADQLAHIKRIFVATDNDNAGHFQANRWHQVRPDSIRILPPAGKDIGEANTSGANLVSWLSSILASTGI